MKQIPCTITEVELGHFRIYDANSDYDYHCMIDKSLIEEYYDVITKYGRLMKKRT